MLSELERGVMKVSVILHQLPARVWDDMDFEELGPVVEAYQIVTHGESAREDEPEELTDYDRAQIKALKDERARKEAQAAQEN